jgi:DNA-binding PadR family transcriptional regulator
VKLSANACAILGMLRLGAGEGGTGSGWYTIRVLLARFTELFWAVDHDEILPELRRLERAGAVTRRPSTEDEGFPQYRITPAGESALRGWLVAGGGLDVSFRHEGIMRLFAAGVLDRNDREQLLEKIRIGHVNERQFLEQVRPELERICADSNEPIPLVVFDAWVEHTASLIGLCDRLQPRLEAADSTREPG